MALVRVGVVLGAFGVRGFFKCAYSTDHPEWLAGRQLYLLVDERTSECLPVATAEVELRGDNFIIRFEGYSAPEQLKPFTGWSLCYRAQSGELPREASEVYYFELVGLEVRRPDGTVLGRVVEVWDNGAHAVLDVEGAITRSIPYQAEFIGEVNLEQGYLITTYPLDYITEDR
jgi:16S rRNA processing protein RimM